MARNRIKVAVDKFYKDDGDELAGVCFVRDMVKWLDNRPEELNTDKSPIKLLLDFADHLLEGYE